MTRKKQDEEDDGGGGGVQRGNEINRDELGVNRKKENKCESAECQTPINQSAHPSTHPSLAASLVLRRGPVGRRKFTV